MGNVAISRNVTILGSGGFRIFGIDSSNRIGLFENCPIGLFELEISKNHFLIEKNVSKIRKWFFENFKQKVQC